MSATLTRPAPIAVSGWTGGADGPVRLEKTSLGELPPAQADSRPPAPNMAARTANQRGTAPARDDGLACEIGNMKRRSP
jgi:hypothetical protein